MGCSLKLNGNFNLKPISEFIIRSVCQLKSLRIENINVNEGELLQVLENFPTITTLILHELYPGVNIPSPSVLTPRRWIIEKLLRCLAIAPNDQAVILPRLKHLNILLSCRISEVDKGWLFRMLASRTHPDLPKGERLKKLFFASKEDMKSYSWVSDGRI